MASLLPENAECVDRDFYWSCIEKLSKEFNMSVDTAEKIVETVFSKHIIGYVK